MPLSWGYGEKPYDPYWGPVTSAANFCEEDYIVTPYIAEIISTLTNLTYLYYAFYGVKVNSHRPDAYLRFLPYFGIAGVGLGSAAFHATLKQYSQWCDELSMIIATAAVFHRVFTFDKSSQVTVVFGAVLATVLTVFVIWHCWTDEIIMHSIVFGIQIIAIGFKTRTVLSTRISSPTARAEVSRLVTFGSVTFSSGFILWNVDNVFCSDITRFKRAIGMPWAFIFELHGWWHLLTGIGSYTFIVLVEYLTSSEAGKPLGDNFAWPVGWFVRQRLGSTKHDAQSNGIMKTKTG